MSKKLEALVKWLDDLSGPASLEAVADVLRELRLGCDDFTGHIRFSSDQYQRNLVRAGRWYHLWLLCWKSGQRSPIHDHRGSNCVVQVLRGTATQTECAFAPNGDVKAVGSEDFSAGSFVLSQDDDLHQISNLQGGEADLVTLHVYSPPLGRVGTYSILDRNRGEETWETERKVVTSFPENSETPLADVQSWTTPTRLFFVRNHFDVPTIDRNDFRLQVHGCVDTPVEWTLDELMALPERSIFATVECAGNGRSFLQEKAPGVQWGAGAIGHAEWTGVPLHLVLEKSGIRPGAVEIVFEGADQGAESDHPEPMNFARGLPLPKALDPNTLLAYRMNGEPLTASHGYPLRLFVPGWYGVASVKWLTRIEVVNQPFGGYFQTVKYTVQRRAKAALETVVVGPMAVKSEIIRPQAGATLGLGMNRISGVAWAGEEPVARVEVSTDGGTTWNPAEMIGMRAPFCWTLWEYLWEVAEPGPYSLCVRAISATGRMQPQQHEPLNGGYVINMVRPLDVHVEARRAAAAASDRDTLLYDMNSFAEENSRRRLDVELEFLAGEGI